MTIKQNLKRFFITSVLISSVVTLGTIGIYVSLYISKSSKGENDINVVKNRYNSLVKQETEADSYVNQIENSSDEKKRNIVKVVYLEQDAILIIKKVSEVNPYFDISLNRIDLDQSYVNVANIYVDLQLKDKELDDSFYSVYGKIVEKAFDKIKNNKIRELIKVNDKQYKIVYKKDYLK